MTKKTFVFGALAIAAIATVAALSSAVYLNGRDDGNGDLALAAPCSTAEAQAARLAPLMKGQVAALIPAQPSRLLQDISFQDASGKALTIDQFTGKTVLFNLWATWCVPCREEMPALNALQNEVGGDQFDVVAVNIDTGDNTKPQKFLTENKIEKLNFYRDPTMGVFNRLKKEGLALGLPATLLINEKGCLVASMNGPAAWDSEDAKALIRALSSKSPQI